MPGSPLRTQRAPVSNVVAIIEPGIGDAASRRFDSSSSSLVPRRHRGIYRVSAALLEPLWPSARR